MARRVFKARLSFADGGPELDVDVPDGQKDIEWWMRMSGQPHLSGLRLKFPDGGPSTVAEPAAAAKPEQPKGFKPGSEPPVESAAAATPKP